MRFPLIPVIILLAFNLGVDLLLRRIMLRSRRLHRWARLHTVLSVLFAILFVVIIAMPKRSGSEAVFLPVMWGIYAYLTVYIPKYIFLVFYALSRLPRLFGHRPWRPVVWTGAGMAAAMFAAMWWGAWNARHHIEVRHVTVTVDGLPEAFDGYRIVQFSDAHVGTFGTDTAFISALTDTILAQRADLIAFTGDIVNRRSSELVPFTSVLSRLKAPDGVYSVMGNHDYGDYYSWPDEAAHRADVDSLHAMQTRMGWTPLRNASVALRRGADSIMLVGVDNVGDPPFRTYGSLHAAYAGVADSTVKILLSHNPAHWTDSIELSPSARVALTLSGHTHAMQAEAFGVSPAALRYRCWGGLYAAPDSLRNLYVNIGCGTVGMPARLGAAPEVTVITLRPR